MALVPPPEFALSVFGTPRFHGGPHREPTLTQRRILERLAVHTNRSVTLEQLIDAAWEENPPKHARAAIQNQISRIRSAWGEHVITTTTTGYSLGVTTDAARLHELSSRAEVLLEDGQPLDAFNLAESILPLWVGRPFTAIEHVSGVLAVRRALSASCKGAENTRLAAGIALGRSAWAVHEAERMVTDSPHDERRQAMLAQALTLIGRRGDALAAIAAARRILRADLGIEAGPLLIRAEDEILHPPTPNGGAHSLAFTGRESEIRAALSGLAQRRIVRVQGEPGSGVTRILRETGTHLRALGVNVIIIDALDHVDSAVGVLRAIATEARFSEDESVGLVDGFGAAVARAAESAPLALVIDNADAVGPSAMAAIDAAVGPRTLLLVGGHSADTRTSLSDVVDVTLGALDRASVVRLTASTVDESLSSEFIDRLLAYSGGNPLALEILLTEHPHSPEAAFEDPEANAAIRLDALAEALLSGLDPAGRAIVEYAAVAGEGYPIDALEDATALTALPRSLVTVSNGLVQFRHGALRDAVYFGIPPARREELHATLGRAARDAEAPTALVARHLIASGPLAIAEAAEACRAAAREAEALGAHADAKRWLRLAKANAAEPNTDSD